TVFEALPRINENRGRDEEDHFHENDSHHLMPVEWSHHQPIRGDGHNSEHDECPRLPGSHKLWKSFSTGEMAQRQEEATDSQKLLDRDAVNCVAELRMVDQRQ